MNLYYISQDCWTQEQAIELCCKIEAVCPAYGCHVALTGGCLYSFGPRKDLDLVFYRIRECNTIHLDGLWGALRLIGIKLEHSFGFISKAMFEGRNIDFLFPESTGTYLTKRN